MNDEQFATLSKKIDFMTHALLHSIIKDMAFKDKVLMLNSMGLKESEIVALLKSNKNSVHSVLWRQKNGS